MINNDLDFKKTDNINERIRLLREYIRVPRSYFEIKYQLSKETLKKWETNSYKINNNSINKIIKIFKNEGVIVPKEWLECGIGHIPMMIPNYDQTLTTEDKSFLISKNIPEELKTSKEIEIILKFYNNTIHLFINDESMQPVYPMDCCVIGIKKSGKYIEEVKSKDCIIKIKLFPHPIARRINSIDNNTYCLSNLNLVESNLNIPSVIVVDKNDIEYFAKIRWVIK